MADVTIRWAGPVDAASGSRYKIERTLNNVDWTLLAAAQSATDPYVSVSSALNGNHAYDVATITVANGASFSSAGYGWLADALVQWTGKSTNDLTGVKWFSGYGTYASGAMLHEAHESYADTGITISLNAVLYRITHTNTSNEVSAPKYIWYYSPPTPESSDHCVVVVNVNADLGISARAAISVDAYLSADSDYAETPGAHLDAGTSANKRQTTNAFGLAFFHCWKNSARSQENAYTFVLDATGTTSRTEDVATIPDRNWVLLADVVT